MVKVQSVACSVLARAVVPARGGLGLGLGTLVLGLGLASGCFTAQLDPDLGGAFACGDSDEEEPCPGSLTCVNGRCEDADEVPVLAVLAPEDEESVERDDVIDVTMGMVPPPGIVELEIRIQGSLELVAAASGATPVLGQGHVKVFIDGVEQQTIDSGSIGASTPVMVSVPLVSGPHRILLQAYRNDGEPYDNPEATATRLFWFENEFSRRPFVAIKSPWPGSVFDVDDGEVEVVLAVTPPFRLVEPGGMHVEDQGHAHIYYDTLMPYPDCVHNAGCDSGYIGVVGGSSSVVLDLPEDEEGSRSITAVLRHVDHLPYGIPFGCDPTTPGPLELCSPVFDSVDVVRVDQ
jgi:hypothetical protein